MESYDAEGRFAAEEGQLNNAWTLVNPLLSLTNGAYQKTRLSIDNLHFRIEIYRNIRYVNLGINLTDLNIISCEFVYTKLQLSRSIKLQFSAAGAST